MQKRFLPQSVPEIPGFEFFAHYEPAYEVGGDYYDFVPLPGNRCAVAVGDVSGKGVAAALMMAKFSGDTRYCILTENSPGAAANELNHLLFAAGIEEKFITLSLSVLDVEQRTLCRSSSAGHPPILIRRANGRVEEVGEEIAGFPLGIIPGRDYKQREITLEPGDVAVVYSDGVTDARNLREELYDSRENRRLIRRLAETSGRAGGRGPGHPPGHPRILGGPRPGRRHHPDLLRAGRPTSRPSRPRLTPRPITIRVPATDPTSTCTCRSRSTTSASSSTTRRELCPTGPRAGSGWARSRSSRWRILRKSLDARRHDDLHFTYAMEVELAEDDARAGPAATRAPTSSLTSRSGSTGPSPDRGRCDHRPVIIGAGPAGLIAGYLLAEQGYRPLILERGRAVKDRVADVRRFDAGGPLDPESNYLFGEGGAGTFSDGKLTSRNTGPDVQRVLEILAECHGKPSILYEHRPHLGSNRLPLVVRTLRRKFEALGGEVRFSCRVEDLDIADGRLRGLCDQLGLCPGRRRVLAIGHSARDTYGMLLRRGVPMEAKPFQFGVRIEQPQEQIDVARYGATSGHPALGAADYALSVRAGKCDLFTFCMCAGGYVMPSVSEPGYFCTNGMSESRHDSPFANSGLVVTIEPAETGSTHPLAGVHFQQRIERLAYLVGGQIVRGADPVGRRLPRRPAQPRQAPLQLPPGRTVADRPEPLPPRAASSRPCVRGLPVMDRRFGGRFLQDATLTGPESRGSSPVRILRDPVTRQSPAVAGLYPCGEGAGFAGGIISAAVDGLRTARAIVATYAVR